MKVSIYAFDSVIRFYFNDNVICNSNLDKYKIYINKKSPNGKYLIEADHKMGYMYTWQIENRDFYKHIMGFKDAGKLLFYVRKQVYKNLIYQ